MYNQRSTTPLLGERTTFLIVFGVIALVLAGGSIGVVSWIRSQLRTFTPPPQTSPIYTSYSNLPSTYLKPESLAAMAKYIAEHPQPQNVQVLKGMDTAAIANYMVGQVAGGLKVDCTYCHNLANGNFAEEQNLPMVEGQNVSRKQRAREMMLMAADLNQNWVKQLPAAVGGKQITCATCHNGLPVNLNGVASTGTHSNYPADQSPIPDSYTLPLDNLDVLLITGKADPNLAAVQLNQYTMYHMASSLGVGCGFCHNANYFPSNERPEKGYALIMLKMAQHINQQYLTIMNNKGPACWMCHRGAMLPPASANSGQVPAVLSSTPSQ
jgi:photosynthetic reaction center cytochrome c subunit